MTAGITVTAPLTVLESYTIITTTDANYLLQENYEKPE